MIRKFISLEWKQKMRSPNLAQNVGVSIFLGFVAFIYAINFIILSVQLYDLLKEYFPEIDPLVSANRFMLYWLFFDLTIRYFFQKLPGLTIRPLLTLNIKKPKIIHYILGKSFFSFLNLIAAFASIPFALTLLYKGYETSQVISWLLFLGLATMMINCLHIIITSKDGQGKEYVGLAIIGFFSLAICLEYFKVFSLGALFGQGVDYLIANPYFLLLPLIALVGIYRIAYKTLKAHLYLDAVLQVKHSKRKTTSLSWVEKIGYLAPLIKVDLRMLWRSKRAKSIFFTTFIFLLYGLLFYRSNSGLGRGGFIAMFMTAGFIYSFGMYIPAWDGSYYRFLMSRDIKMEDYLKSKYILMVAVTSVAFILTIPYVYFGWNILLMQVAGFFYNIGIGTFIMLYYGSFRRRAMDLNSGSSFNFQGTMGRDYFIIFPLILIPLLLFSLIKYFLGFYVAIGVFIFLGVVGLLFRDKIIERLAKRYKNVKHKMLVGFSQK